MTAPDLTRAAWRKSSYSTNDGNCVEVAWLKSSYSASEGNCVEVAHLGEPTTAVRDSKNPTGPALIFPTPTWSRFLHRTS